MKDIKHVTEVLNAIAEEIHCIARSKGFYDEKRNVGEMLMLAVSELAEAMEGYRKDMMDDHLPNRTMLEVELADCIIRCLDTAFALRLDIGGAIVEKMDYNRGRPYKHGKKC